MRISFGLMLALFLVLTGCGEVDQNPTEFKPGFVLEKFDGFMVVRMDQLTSIPELKQEIEKNQPPGSDIPLKPEEMKTVVAMARMAENPEDTEFGAVIVLKDAATTAKVKKEMDADEALTQGEWQGRVVYSPKETNDPEVKMTLLGHLLVVGDAKTFEEMMTAYLEGKAPGKMASTISAADPEAELILYGNLDAVRTELNEQLASQADGAAKTTATELLKLSKDAQLAMTFAPEVSIGLKATAISADAAKELEANLKATVNSILKPAWNGFKGFLEASPQGKQAAATVDKVFEGTKISSQGDVVTMNITGFGKLSDLVDQGKSLAGGMMGGARPRRIPPNLKQR